MYQYLLIFSVNHRYERFILRYTLNINNMTYLTLEIDDYTLVIIEAVSVNVASCIRSDL